MGGSFRLESVAGLVWNTHYAHQANYFASEMKLIDPEIMVGAVFEVSFLQAAWMNAVLPHMTTWNDEVLATLSNDIDFMSVHFYAPFDKLGSSDALSHLVLASPMVFSQNLELLGESLQTYNRNDLTIAVTEYNTFFGDEIQLDERTAEPEAALFQGLMLFEMMRNPKVVLANNWSLINNSVFGMMRTNINGDVSTRPTYPVFQSLAQQANNQLLSSSISSPGYTVDPIGNIPEIEHVPYLDAVVTHSLLSGHTIVNVINRSMDQSSMLTITGLPGGLEVDEIISYSGTSALQWHLPVYSKASAGQPIRISPFSYTQIIYR
jgi:alpha-N-arabinofuranosidase